MTAEQTARALQEFRGPERARFLDASAKLKCVTAARRGDISVEDLRSRAEGGDFSAQFHLAEALRLGKEIPEDLAEALRWYTRSAEAGCADAQNNLGQMYLNGLGADKDLALAAQWYEKAAAQRLPTGLFNLACLALDGRGVSRNPERSARLFEDAIFVGYDGHGEAQRYLGLIFLREEPLDLSMAAHFLIWGAEEGDEQALTELRQEWRTLEPALIARGLKPNIGAVCDLARIYCRGLVAARDPARAYAWLGFGYDYLPAGEWSINEENLFRCAQRLESLLSVEERRRSEYIEGQIKQAAAGNDSIDPLGQLEGGAVDDAF